MFKNLSRYYDSLSYHCPASKAMTTKILKQIQLKNTQPAIANFGFGKGDECLLLAELYPNIVAVENNIGYIEKFTNRIEQLNLRDKIQLVAASLENPPFEKNSFDLILSEGGINYSDFGFRINSWKPFLKDGGYLALSELCILKEVELPYELADFLCDSYPFREIETIDYKLVQIKDADYRVCGQHKLSDSCWFDYFKDKFDCYLEMPKKWQNSKEGYQVAEYIEQARYFYAAYKEYFGYVYFILRKPPIKAESL